MQFFLFRSIVLTSNKEPPTIYPIPAVGTGAPSRTAHSAPRGSAAGVHRAHYGGMVVLSLQNDILLGLNEWL